MLSTKDLSYLKNIMADIKQVLTEEIRRLARKEIKAEVKMLNEKIISLRNLVRKQYAELKALKGSAVQTTSLDEKMVVLSDKTPKKVRINAKAIRKIREKLGVSQKDLAKIIGASHLSVCHWESGKSSPRAEFKKRIADLRKMGKRQIKALPVSKRKPRGLAKKLMFLK